MRSKTVLFLSTALIGLFSSVAASDKYDVIVVVDEGATKVEKAVSLENVCTKLIVQDVDRVKALAIDLAATLPSAVEVSVQAPTEVFSINPESSAYRVRPPTLATINQFTGRKPPANLSRAEV